MDLVGLPSAYKYTCGSLASRERDSQEKEVKE